MHDDQINKIAAELNRAIPHAWHVTAQVVQTEAIIYLSIAGFFFVMGLIALLVLIVPTIRLQNSNLSETPLAAVCTIGSIIGALSMIVGASVMLFSPWVWITALHPSFGAAHIVLSRLGL